MEKIKDGYYFMCEIGWFMDLLIPTLIRIKDGKLCLVGSKPYQAKDLRPCCIPAGGAKECKELSLDDPVLNAFKSIDSLVALNDLQDLEGELEKCLGSKTVREKYLNTTAKKQREATLERIVSDYRVLLEKEE